MKLLSILIFTNPIVSRQIAGDLLYEGLCATAIILLSHNDKMD